MYILFADDMLITGSEWNISLSHVKKTDHYYISKIKLKIIREKESNLIKQSITFNICWYMPSFAKSLNLHVLPLTQTTSWHSKKYLHFLTLLISIHITLSSNLPYSQFFQNSTYFNDNYQTVLVEVIDIMYYKVNTCVSK